MVAGKEAKYFGEGKNSWLTGTAAWTFTDISQYILGVYPTHKGLQIDPCVPDDFGDFGIHRLFRGVEYNISVTNPDHVEKGVKEMYVDGKKIDGCIIPFDASKKKVDVKVVMG